jgi:hypothetical protein
VRMNIYIPDTLAEQVRTELAEANISAICQAALQDELERRKAMAGQVSQGFERVELFDGKRERDVIFQGRELYANDGDAAWLTPKGSIAAFWSDGEELVIYDSFRELAEPPAGLIQASEAFEMLVSGVASALGEKYAEVLDI